MYSRTMLETTQSTTSQVCHTGNKQWTFSICTAVHAHSIVFIIRPLIIK